MRLNIPLIRARAKGFLQAALQDKDACSLGMVAAWESPTWHRNRDSQPVI